MKILAIETSCDETASAIVEDGVYEIASVISSSAKLHEKTGGVVPEVAARKQLEFIMPVIEEVFTQSNLTQKDIDAIAVTVGPGLVGSLIVGVEAAKTLSMVWNKPLIPVNHLVGHIYANFLLRATSSGEAILFPALVLIVSGGHTDLVLMQNHGKFEYIGGTLDDAAGEAFDKTARLLNIQQYLGGAALSKIASTCVVNTLQGKLPRPMLREDNFDFSFSGLKTAVRYMVEKSNYPVEVVAYEFETAVVDVLVDKTMRAAKKYAVSSILLGGGVAANKPLRERLNNSTSDLGVPVFIPPVHLCGDNAVYIASAAFFNPWVCDVKVVIPNPSLGIVDGV